MFYDSKHLRVTKTQKQYDLEEKVWIMRKSLKLKKKKKQHKNLIMGKMSKFWEESWSFKKFNEKKVTIINKKTKLWERRKLQQKYVKKVKIMRKI